MQGSLLSLGILLVPLLLVIFLRTNAAVLFFVVCGASTLQTYLDKDVSGFTAALLPGKATSVLPMVILLLPFIVAALAFRRTVTTKMLLLHAIIAILVGLTAVFVAGQFLPKAVTGLITVSPYFKMVQPYSSFVIAAAFLLSVVVLWLSHPKQEHGHGKHGH